MTPTDKIEQRLSRIAGNPTLEGRRLVVLMEGGCFNPVHMGHIQIMKTAKKEMEAQGAIVLGGYLCPADDDYVRAKLGHEALDAICRLRLIEQAVRDSNWLMADPSESLGSERWLGFAYVITRLEHFLSTHVRSNQAIEVVYVV